MEPSGQTGASKGIGLRLRASLVIFPLVAAILVLALAPIRSYLRLRAAMDDGRRDLAFVLHLCRFDIQAARQSVEYFDVAFRDEDPRELEELAQQSRATLEALARLDLTTRQAERLKGIRGAYQRLTEAGERAIELAQRGERETEPPAPELQTLIDEAQIEGSLALRRALDSLLATSAQLALVSPMAGLEADARKLRREAAEAISVCRFARQAQRLLGDYRRFAVFGEPWEDLAIAEHELDHAYRVWEAQSEAGDEDGQGMSPEEMADVGADYQALKRAIGRITGLDRDEAQAIAFQIYESEIEPLGNDSLPQVLSMAFDSHDAKLLGLLDSIAMRSRVGGTVLGAVALLVLSLALVCPWLISRWIVHPVLTLTRATRELGAGAEGRPVSVRASGEIAELGASFNRMADQLSQRTRELEAERAREKLHHAERLASVGILAAGLAHQINNPINNILLTVEHALGEQGPEAPDVWREALAASAEEAKRCERIVRGMVAFSRGDPGQKWREDANQVLRRACGLTEDTAAEREAVVELRLDREPAPILANPIALEQALVNIIRNAIQSGPKARVILSTVRVGQAVRIAIRDDGRGLDREALGRLFDPFYTTRGDEGGLGLGLSVAHRIITDHGGEIRVDSRPGEGTTVTVDLPLDPPPSR